MKKSYQSKYTLPPRWYEQQFWNYEYLNVSPLNINMIIIGYQWNWRQSHSSWAQAWECGRWERLPRSFSSSKLSSSLSAEIDMWLLFIIIIKLKIDLLTCLLFKAAKALPLFLMIFKMFMLKKVKVAKGRRFNSTVLKKRFSRQFSECWLDTWFQKRKRAGNYSIVMIRMKTMPSLHW